MQNKLSLLKPLLPLACGHDRTHSFRVTAPAKAESCDTVAENEEREVSLHRQGCCALHLDHSLEWATACWRQDANHRDASRLLRLATGPDSSRASQYEASWMVTPWRSACRNALLPWPLPGAPCASLWPHLHCCSGLPNQALSRSLSLCCPSAIKCT